MLDQTERSDGPTELLALEGVAGGDLERFLRGPDGTGAQFEPAQVQNIERDVRALAGFAEQIPHGHLGVFQNHAAGRGRFDAQLVFFFAERDAGESSLDEKRGGVLPIHLGKDGEQIRPRRVRDPHLGPVKEVVLAVRRKRGFGTQAEGIGAGTGFAERVSCHPFAGRQF